MCSFIELLVFTLYPSRIDEPHKLRATHSIYYYVDYKQHTVANGRIVGVHITYIT